LDVSTLTELLREAEQHHGEYEPTSRSTIEGRYVAYIVARQNGKTPGQRAAEILRAVEPLTGKFIIPFVEWGMQNPSNFLLKVSDKVEIDFVAIGHVSGAHATGK